jgi:hypothetical protein
MNVGLAARFDAAEVYEDASHYMGHASQSAPVWGKPDMSVMKANLAPAVPFPVDVLGQLWPLVSELAEGAGAPVEYVATSMLAVAASLIGGKRWVQAWDGYEQPCILWAAVVGDPSSNKSPAIDVATLPLRAMEADLAEYHRSVMMNHAAVAERAKQERKAWEDQVKTATKENVATPSMPDAADAPDAPERKRLVVQDSTPEEMASIRTALCTCATSWPDGSTASNATQPAAAHSGLRPTEAARSSWTARARISHSWSRSTVSAS